MDPSQPLPSQIFRSQQSQSQIVTTQTKPSSSQIDPSQPLFSQIDDSSQPSSSQTVPLQAVPLIPQVTINPPRPTLSCKKISTLSHSYFIFSSTPSSTSIICSPTTINFIFLSNIYNIFYSLPSPCKKCHFIIS